MVHIGMGKEQLTTQTENAAILAASKTTRSMGKENFSETPESSFMKDLGKTVNTMDSENATRKTESFPFLEIVNTASYMGKYRFTAKTEISDTPNATRMVTPMDPKRIKTGLDFCGLDYITGLFGN
eukprot:368961_1